VARTTAGSARLEVRTGDPERGPVVASLEVRATGGPYNWREVAAPVRAGGVEDIYVVLAGEQKFASLWLQKPA
jgi:hypothetical protein